MQRFVLGSLVCGGVLLAAGCASSGEWNIWRQHPTHFASGDHLLFSIRNTEGTAPSVTRQDIAGARQEGWWGKPVTVAQGQILEARVPRLATPSDVFIGEVWTWNAKAGTVTLRQVGGRTVRVKVAPEALEGLRLHQMVTVDGELAPPAEIERIQVPAGPMTPVPRGSPTRSEVTGTIATIERGGTVSIASPQGLLRVWVAPPTEGRFHPGSPVRVRTTVQPVRMVPVSVPGATSPMPSVPVGSQPGDYAVVIGRITAVDRDGQITVESPRGPVSVWVPANVRYGVGETVEVRTSVHPSV